MLHLNQETESEINLVRFCFALFLRGISNCTLPAAPASTPQRAGCSNQSNGWGSAINTAPGNASPPPKNGGVSSQHCCFLGISTCKKQAPMRQLHFFVILVEKSLVKLIFRMRVCTQSQQSKHHEAPAPLCTRGGASCCRWRNIKRARSG